MTIERKIRKEIAGIVAEERKIKPSLLNENLRNYLASRRSTLGDVLVWTKQSPIAKSKKKR